MARARASRASSSAGQRGGGNSASVLAFRNRTLSVYRGTTVDELGDEIDSTTPLCTGIPAALAEVSDVSYDAATQRQQIIRSIKCTVPAWADIVDTDTLQDEFTGYYYIIESVEAQPGIGYYPAEQIFTLLMRSDVSIGE